MPSEHASKIKLKKRRKSPFLGHSANLHQDNPSLILTVLGLSQAFGPNTFIAGRVYTHMCAHYTQAQSTHPQTHTGNSTCHTQHIQHTPCASTELHTPHLSWTHTDICHAHSIAGAYTHTSHMSRTQHTHTHVWRHTPSRDAVGYVCCHAFLFRWLLTDACERISLHICPSLWVTQICSPGPSPTVHGLPFWEWQCSPLWKPTLHRTLHLQKFPGLVSGVSLSPHRAPFSVLQGPGGAANSQVLATSQCRWRDAENQLRECYIRDTVLTQLTV